MKKFLSVLVLFIALAGTPTLASVSTVNNNLSLSGQNDKAISKDEINRIVNRVDEIRQMDKKNLSAAERKSLKNELMTMKKRVAEPGAGIYISGTALILIIILLIILL